MNNRLYVDVHVIQTVPPSCVNRDDTNSPKTAIYGGVTRARVSSQCWKKAVRDMFRTDSMFALEKLGSRTKKIVGMIAEEIQKLDNSLDAEGLAIKILEAAGLKIKSESEGTGALFFISSAQVKALAQLTISSLDADRKTLTVNKKAAQKTLKDSPGIDIALFGRMVADDPSLNTDACAQVAHAISTHKTSNEFDYFTAVDDLSPEDTSGAGHIGTIEFNSSTLYRYATIAVHALAEQLGSDTVDAVSEFVRAFACSMPTGKLNSFANRTAPDAMLITMRIDQPVNLVGAFEKPIETHGGYVEGSAVALVAHAKRTYKDWLKEPESSFVVGDTLLELGTPCSLNDSLAALRTSISIALSSNEAA